MCPRMSKQPLLIAPSLLSADFSKLGSEVAEVEEGGADWLHIDVMDGHFVPNLTIGPLVVEALQGKTKLPMDCHLMVSEPGRWLESFSKAGAASITIHAEASVHLDRELRQIADLGCKAGVSINPATPLSLIEQVLPLVDLVLIMSVNPGFGGQKFIASSTEKIQKLSKYRAHHALGFLIEVDGGVGTKNMRELRDAGTDVFVAGSAVFGQKDRAAAIRGLREAAES